ncbi:methyl-accepting chemotaxis protein [Tritonibacter scottomollicae]|uniref:Methyl-accepting chemotaxis protein n=1 Tax=Tritonibacter scottomollicae TaxID=483013 RepID=A0ABZ0HGS5_TRISK|nr:methyl-accepting chemotaxis protein [Tritonibacter scottomollicae]WOI33136.1 methyl-accepting chemotaxis protein [Tritonibacter scottomollicae]
MTDTSTIKPARRRRFGLLRSIRAKMGMILLLMGISFGLFAYMMYSVLNKIDQDMTNLNTEKLPDLVLAGEISLAAGLAKDGMISLMIADDTAGIDAAVAKVATSTEMLLALISDLDETMQPEFEAGASEVSDALTDLASARRMALESDAQIDVGVEDLHRISSELRGLMMELTQSASVELNKGAVATYSAIDDSLKTLVEVDFQNLKMLLEARAELNLLAGTAVAFGGTKDPTTLAELQKLADSSDARLLELADLIEANAPELLDVSLLRNASFTLQSVIAQSLFPSETLRQAAMKARADTERFIVMGIDAQVDKLSIAADRASKENGDALRRLMKNEVGFLNTLMDISAGVNAFQVAALDVITSNDEALVNDAAFDMSSASMNLSFYEDFEDVRVGDLLKKLGALNAPETGLAALRINVLNARAAADVATRETEVTVVGIAERAANFAAGSLTGIGGMARDISAEIATANRNLIVSLGWIAGVFLTALLLMQMLVMRPLNRVSASTERLANGDRSPVVGFERASTEIFRIARSLSVFRDGIVEKEEMERLAEEERSQRMAAQEKAVSALGNGLSRLSEGDLTARIDYELSEGYEQLRADFNRTLDTLNETVGQVVETSSSIRNGASEISQASQDLSHRTESQAATLEQTAAALDEMTASVKSAAEGARDVESTTNETRSEAEASGDIVKNAVSAMTEIEQSSSKISQIISVIDDIAFQTNLLALNAGVEAARAGEAGRGFAVVASEVRGLAQRSSDAALEIKNLISDSSKQVERGVDLVGKAGGALESILQRVSHISQLISGIATGAQEQSTGLAEINTGMNQLDQVTQQNAAMVEQATAAGQLLNSDAQTLGELVARFQTAQATHLSVEAPQDAPAEIAPEPTSWGNGDGAEWETAEPIAAPETDWTDFNWDENGQQATGTS